VVFAVIEQKEPHAGRMAFADIAQPGTFAERCALAKRLRDELEVPLPIYVDGMDDASRALFSDLPSPAFLIGRDGRIFDKLPWADPAPLTATLEAALASEREMPEIGKAEATLAQRVAAARRCLANRDAARALIWLAVPSDAAEPAPSATDRAHAALARALALQSSAASERAVALESARQAIATAWANDAARASAARIELALAGADTPLASDLWREALAGLDPRAPALTREWLEQRVAKPSEAERKAR
jgi:hypothetical protein